MALRRTIDDMLFDLEDLAFRGIDRVPASLRERALRIFHRLSVSRPTSLRPYVRVRPMMDALFVARDMVTPGNDPPPGAFMRDAA